MLSSPSFSPRTLISRLLLLVAFVPRVTLAFQPAAPLWAATTPHRRVGLPPLQASSSSSPTTPDEMFASEGWKKIRGELDSLPVFCCANEKGQPLQYNVNGETKMPFFYCDVQAVEEEMLKAKAELPKEMSEKLGIIPFPLGNAFELMARNQAAVIPSATALEAAGVPPGTNPLGQQIPLFCCMEIMQESPTSKKPVLPIFMVHAEAQQAMEQALASDDSKKEEGQQDVFEIVSLSLPRAVELLATNGEEAPSFHFLPPVESINYIQKYLDNERESFDNDDDDDDSSS